MILAAILGASVPLADLPPLANTAGALRLLDTASVSAGLHWGVPCGSLSFLPAVPAIRVGASSSYADGIRATGFLQYAQLPDSIDIWYASTGAGLELLLPLKFSLAGMLVLHYARSTTPHNPPLLLDSGESEFGTDLRLAWTTTSGRWSFRPGAQASVAFTRPSPSWWIWSGVDASWNLW